MQFIKSMFSSSKLTDTAIDGIRKLGGLDEMSDKEKADYLLKYIDATKHQSPMRRFIAFAFVAGWMLFSGFWLIATVFMWVYLFFGGDVEAAKNLDLLRTDLFDMLKEILAQPVNLIISFYFVSDIARRFK